MTNYYRVDGGKLTYGEYWRMSPDPLSFLIAAGLKLIRLPIKFNFTIPRPDQLFVVDFAELPSSARSEMKPMIRSAEKDGMQLSFCHRLAVVERHRIGAAAILLDEEEQIALTVIFGKHNQKRELQLTCCSVFADDTRAITTTMRKTMVPVPGNVIERYPGASPPALLDHHRHHLERLADEGLVPLRLDASRMPEVVLDWELSYVDYHIDRGVFVPMSEDEVDDLAEA
jgi:hypothetical protein